MKRFFRAWVLGFALFPAAARAQVQGLRVEGGPVFLTKSGKLSFGPSEIESDAGFAIRGRLRYGFGALSIAADLQASNQKYGKAAAPGAPKDLDATFIGAVGALHPFKIAGVAPYAEIGVGRLSFSDGAISEDGGVRASSYGLGVFLGGEGRLAADVELRLMRQTGLKVQGTAQEFKYDPKLFSVMLSLRL